MQGEKGEEQPRRKETMKKKHRERILSDHNKDRKIIEATKKRLSNEISKGGSGYDSAMKYMKQLERR